MKSLGLFILYLLLFEFFLAYVIDFNDKINFTQITFLLSSIYSFLYLIIEKKPLKKYVFIYLCFSIYVVLISYIMIERAFSPTKMMLYFYKEAHFRSFLLMNVVATLSLTDKDFNRIIKIVKFHVYACVTILFVRFIYPNFWRPTELGFDIEVSQRGYFGSIYGWMMNNTFGLNYPILLSIYISYNKVIGNKLKSVFFIATFLPSILTQARYVIVSHLTILYQNVKMKKALFLKIFHYFIYIMMLLLVIFYILNLIGYNVFDFIERRILSESGMTRFFALEMFIQEFPKNPIFGTGGIQTESLIELRAGRSSQIHVGFLSLFYYYGLIGGILYCWVIYLLLKKFYNVFIRTGFTGLFYGLLSFVFANMTLVQLRLDAFAILISISLSNYLLQKRFMSETKYNQIYPSVKKYNVMTASNQI